jgi:hypothetical protein
MAQFQVLVTMIVEADSDSEAGTIAEAALDHLVWPGTPILACEVDEVSPDMRGRLTLTEPSTCRRPTHSRRRKWLPGC